MLRSASSRQGHVVDAIRTRSFDVFVVLPTEEGDRETEAFKRRG